MDLPLSRMLRQFETTSGAAEHLIESLISYATTRLPNDYISFLHQSNGAIGVGPNLYVVLWRAEEIVQLNEASGVREFAPGLLLIGSDGCGNLLGIDTRSMMPEEMTYVWVDSMSLEWDEIRHTADSLGDLLEHLDQYYGK